MLVLSRKHGQKIMIGEGEPAPIVLTVLDIRGDRVRLGIEAPADMRITRPEWVPRASCPPAPGDDAA